MNFAVLKARKRALNMNIRLDQADDIDEQIENANLTMLNYDKRWGAYQLKLSAKDIENHKELLGGLLEQAFKQRNG